MATDDTQPQSDSEDLTPYEKAQAALQSIADIAGIDASEITGISLPEDEAFGPPGFKNVHIELKDQPAIERHATEFIKPANDSNPIEALKENVALANKLAKGEITPETTEADIELDSDLDEPAPELTPPGEDGEAAETDENAEATTDQPEAQAEKQGWGTRLWKALTGWIPGFNKNDEKNREAKKIPPSFDSKEPLGEDAESTDEPVLSAEPHTNSEPNFTLVGNPEPSPQPSRRSKTTGFNHPDDVTYRGDLNGGRVNFARRSLSTIARHLNINPKKIKSVSPVYDSFGELIEGDVEVQPRRGFLWRKKKPMVRHFSEDRLLPENVQKMIYLANGYAQGRYGKTAEPAPAKAPKAKKPKGEGWWSRWRRKRRESAKTKRETQQRTANQPHNQRAQSFADGDSGTPEPTTTARPEPVVTPAAATAAGAPPADPPNPPENPGNTNNDGASATPPPTPPHTEDPAGGNQNDGDDITPPEGGSPEDGNNAGEPPKPPQQPPAANNTGAGTPPPAAPSPIIEGAQKRKSLTKIADDMFNITFAENRQGIDLHDVQKAYTNDNGDLVLSLNDPNAQPRVVSAEALAKLGTASVIALDLNALKAHRQAVSARHPASPDHIAANFNPANDDEPPTETYGPPAPTGNGDGNDQKTVFDRLAQDMARNAAGQKGGRITADSKYGEAFAVAILGQEAPELKLHDIKGVTSDKANGNVILELKDGELRDLPIDIAETHFQSTRDLALAMNLAKQKDNRQASELFLADLKNGGAKMGPTIEELESASVNKKGKLVLRLKDGSKRHYGVKTKVNKSRFDSAEDLADSVNAAIYNEEWRQKRENGFHPEVDAA